MKKGTQKNAVLQLLIEGKILNWLSAYKLTGCSSVARRIPEFEKLGYVFNKDRVTFKTRFKTSGSYINYSLNFKKTKKSLLIF